VAGESSYALVQYAQHTGDGAPRLGVLADGQVRALPVGWPPSALALFDAWETWSGRLQDLDGGDLDLVEGAELVAPITYPRKVLCAGANYYDHAAEMGTARPDPGATPFFFLKPPSTTVVGPYADLVVEDVTAAQLDWEVELAVVIGHRCRDVPLERARGVIAGYAVANDLSARGRFSRPDAVFPPFAWDWLAHKGLDSSCPLGPVVPAWAVPDPQALGLRLRVNGEVQQDSSTADMVVGVDALVAAASALVTLEPGDVILTGTPAGVGMPRQTFLAPGDVVVAEVDGLGRLENRVVERAVVPAHPPRG
jgi:2-keto-4-pentenoate hydratase/2-oxohepta-3-ene-1,7-dioic acid hydratase in catechol pathway